MTSNYKVRLRLNMPLRERYNSVPSLKCNNPLKAERRGVTGASW